MIINYRQTKFEHNCMHIYLIYINLIYIYIYKFNFITKCVFI